MLPCTVHQCVLSAFGIDLFCLEKIEEQRCTVSFIIWVIPIWSDGPGVFSPKPSGGYHASSVDLWLMSHVAHYCFP